MPHPEETTTCDVYQVVIAQGETQYCDHKRISCYLINVFTTQNFGHRHR